MDYRRAATQPRVLRDSYALLAMQLAEFVEQFRPTPLPSTRYPGAAKMASGGFDIARDFTEQWHHQMQIRDAVGAGALPGANGCTRRCRRGIALRGLPHALPQGIDAKPGATLLIEVSRAAVANGRCTMARVGRSSKVRRMNRRAQPPRCRPMLRGACCSTALAKAMRPAVSEPRALLAWRRRCSPPVRSSSNDAHPPSLAVAVAAVHAVARRPARRWRQTRTGADDAALSHPGQVDAPGGADRRPRVRFRMS